MERRQREVEDDEESERGRIACEGIECIVGEREDKVLQHCTSSVPATASYAFIINYILDKKYISIWRI